MQEGEAQLTINESRRREMSIRKLCCFGNACDAYENTLLRSTSGTGSLPETHVIWASGEDLAVRTHTCVVSVGSA